MVLPVGGQRAANAPPADIERGFPGEWEVVGKDGEGFKSPQFGI